MSASLLVYGRKKMFCVHNAVVFLPKQASNSLDMGANVDCTAENFVQFANLGSMYYSILSKKAAPNFPADKEKKVPKEMHHQAAYKLLSRNKSLILSAI